MTDFIFSISHILYTTLAFVVFLGMCFSSFFNVVSLRYKKINDVNNAHEVSGWLEELKIPIPEAIKELINNKINLSFPASHCYSCNTPLKWYHNIPVLSYIFLRGKCGFCKTSISLQYPIVETLGGLILGFLFYMTFITPIQGVSDIKIIEHHFYQFVYMSVFFMLTYLLLLIDYKTMFLPDSLNYALLWSGLLGLTFGFKFMPISLNEGIQAAVYSYMFFWVLNFLGKKIKGVDVIGAGDFKLVAAMGVFIGIQGIFFTIFTSPILGIITFLISKTTKSGEFPYGPSLIISAWVYIFYGQQILKFIL